MSDSFLMKERWMFEFNLHLQYWKLCYYITKYCSLACLTTWGWLLCILWCIVPSSTETVTSLYNTARKDLSIFFHSLDNSHFHAFLFSVLPVSLLKNLNNCTNQHFSFSFPFSFDSYFSLNLCFSSLHFSHLHSFEREFTYF